MRAPGRSVVLLLELDVGGLALLTRLLRHLLKDGGSLIRSLLVAPALDDGLEEAAGGLVEGRDVVHLLSKFVGAELPDLDALDEGRVEVCGEGGIDSVDVEVDGGGEADVFGVLLSVGDTRVLLHLLLRHRGVVLDLEHVSTPEVGQREVPLRLDLLLLLVLQVVDQRLALVQGGPGQLGRPIVVGLVPETHARLLPLVAALVGDVVLVVAQLVEGISLLLVEIHIGPLGLSLG
mmetsp:Transcript_13234/g.22456  ORF Transcript_13234/g.22456 Transcript_13234/m.22456 type:complete len:234 (-) Transcript_13234:296-997(-)